MHSEEPLTESAKAVQEVAKTSGKAIDGAREFGGFIAKYIGGTVEQALGIFEDKLKYYRFENQIRLMQRASQLLKEIGLSAPTRPIPLKFAIPLLEAASLEDDIYLQDLWANLLVNAANNESCMNFKNSYIEILKSLTPMEALILKKIYSQPYEVMQHNGVITEGLPEEIRLANQIERLNPLEPKEEIQLALSNLARLGCINPTRTWGGGELFSKVNPTLLGKFFVEACTLQKRHSQ
ncbi:MAG: hypothetical protein A2054_01325 [Deltaproteobacteria bacterium GWA2_55_10]|nr:MAG: hypothetical protein A2054_01325 [Deltaproteobacteria bacterium GWA2_55_10]